MPRYIKTTLIFLGIGIVGLIVSFITSESLCIFYRFSGVPCPSCGMTRAYKALIFLDIKGAFFYHPLFIVPLLIPVVQFMRDQLKLFGRKTENILVIVIFVVLLVVWIVRLIVYFPNNEPMLWNPNSLLGFLIGFIRSVFLS